MLGLTDERAANGKDWFQSVYLLDLTTGQMRLLVAAAGPYQRIAWLDNDHYVLMAQDAADDPQRANTRTGRPAAAAIVRAVSGATQAVVGARCFMAVLPGGRLIGASLANCRRDAGDDRQLQIWADGRWRNFAGQIMPANADVRQIAVSPVGDRLAYGLRMGGTMRIVVADLATGATIRSLDLDSGTDLTRISFSPDGRRLWVAMAGMLEEWTIDALPDADGRPVARAFPVRIILAQRMASNGRRLMISGPAEERIHTIDLANGHPLAATEFAGAAAVGMMRTRPILWAASTSGGIRFWDQLLGRVLATVALLPDGRFVAVAPDGRYDTNMGPDSEKFRWLFSDQPDRSLPPQTLMRDFYEPRMIAKLMDCTSAGRCASILQKVPPVAGLNRELPLVAVTAVRATDNGAVAVDVEAREIRDARTGLASGVHGIKLLMNNREVAADPVNDFNMFPDLAAWRNASFTREDDASGVRRWCFLVPIPSDGKPIEFAAYSFNADRVKSDTARLSWQPPPQRPRPRRAFVLTIGVNHYQERRLQLGFAVPDAELIGQRLAAIPGHDVQRTLLTTSRGRQVTSQDILDAIALLGPLLPVTREKLQSRLRAGGHDPSRLREATPDDVVIISFSGHGVADSGGNFALLASDTRWDLSRTLPDPRRAVEMASLTSVFRAIHAGEIAFIIDACHSGAAVDTPDFKPGPMGDPGLGQLAFDKGLRILAATQADNVALEDAALAQGFLTAALGEGLTPSGGPADLDGNKAITLDEWLRYAVQRLPSLEAEMRSGTGPLSARGVLLVMPDHGPPPRAQQPSLFDFTNAASPVLLRTSP